MDDKLPYLRDNVTVSVQLPKSQVTDLQYALNKLLEGKSQEQITAINDKLLAKGELEPWELAAAVLVRLLQVIISAAKEQDLLDYRSIDQVIGGAI